MFQVFPSMKPQFAEMQTRIEKILSDGKIHPLSEHFDVVLQSFFGKDPLSEDAHFKSIETIYEYNMERKEFYQLLARALHKVLRQRELKKIEEIIAHYSRSPQQADFNRIKLDKILRECFKRIDESAGGIHRFADNFETYQNLECHCNKQQCMQRQSYEQFLIDLFGFFIRSSQLFSHEVDSARQREMVLHPIFRPNFQPSSKEDWVFGKKAGDLVLQIQRECQKIKAKKRKRNKKQKNKQAEDVLEVIEQLDEQERSLNSFLGNLTIDAGGRLPCLVTEEWLARITSRCFPIHK